MPTDQPQPTTTADAPAGEAMGESEAERVARVLREVRAAMMGQVAPRRTRRGIRAESKAQREARAWVAAREAKVRAAERAADATGDDDAPSGALGRSGVDWSA